MPTATIAELKRAIEAREGIPRAQQRLIYMGEQLEDERTVAHYGIKDYREVLVDSRVSQGLSWHAHPHKDSACRLKIYEF